MNPWLSLFMHFECSTYVYLVNINKCYCKNNKHLFEYDDTPVLLDLFKYNLSLDKIRLYKIFTFNKLTLVFIFREQTHMDKNTDKIFSETI